MAQTKRENYLRERAKIEEWAEAHRVAASGNVPGNRNWPFVEPDDAEAILRWCSAYDGEDATVTTKGNGADDRWGKSRAPTTLRQWAYAVSSFAREVDGSLLEATTDELNAAAQRMKDGTAVAISDRSRKNGGLSGNSVRTRQNCLKKFLQWAGDDAAGDPDMLHIFDADSTLVDPADMLTQEEFHALRNAPEHPRDRAITNLFLYTGQRNHAIRTLRVKDVNLSEGTYRLNTTVDGLKGADRVATWNPLLGATGALKDWMGHHPAPDDPDAYLITERRSNNNQERDPYSTISDDTVNKVLRDAAAAAAEEYPEIAQKPTNAHAMRHNFVTMCKVVYDMDNDTIKRLIRHKPDSTVMETTYAHLSDEDYIEKAEVAFGLRDEADASTMSPKTCDVCREQLPPNAKACSNCGYVFTPDAKKVEQDLQRDVGASSALAEGDVDAALEDIANDDAIMAKLIELRSQ